MTIPTVEHETMHGGKFIDCTLCIHVFPADVYVVDDDAVVPSCLREDIDFLEGQFPMAGYIF